VEELVAQLMCQPPVAEGRTEPAVAVAEEPTATKAEEEALAEAGLVDIASILWRPNCDNSPVELVSEDLSRVVHVVW
jgi:hypothetical protein